MMNIRKIYEAQTLNHEMSDYIELLDDIFDHMQQGNLSVFTGAGLSVASGYVDWKKLLSPISNSMHLSLNNDLPELAQFYMNMHGRQKLNDIIYKEFMKAHSNNDNVIWLAKLPIKEYWTTNYDDVLEKVLEAQGKEVDVIIQQESIKYHNPNNEVVVYKMHGDKKYPDSVVLTKQDYQNYDLDRDLFTKLLSIGLVSRTFLFVGFSFKDPNLERILSIAKNSLKSGSTRRHYCFMRKVQIKDYIDNNATDATSIDSAVKEFIEASNYQKFRINDLEKNYMITTILIDDFEQITYMFKYLYNRYIAYNVFISGGINPNDLSNYGKHELTKEENSELSGNNSKLNVAESFLMLLGEKLIDNGFQIYTGFGAGVGNYVLSGVLSSQKNNSLDLEYANSKIHIRNLMQVENDKKHTIRNKLIDKCSSAIFLFCILAEGEVFEHSGYYSEFQIAKQLNKFIIPVNATGTNAVNIYKSLSEEYIKKGGLSFLDSEKNIEKLVDGIIAVLKENNKTKENELKEEMKSLMSNDYIQSADKIGVFISYHYKKDNKIAKKITNIIENGSDMYYVVKENSVESDPNIIKDWVDKNIKNTKITILLISKETFEREYVNYELEKSYYNRNIILPIIIDRKESDFCDKNQETNIIKKLSNNTICLGMKYWYRCKGAENVLQWVKECIECTSKFNNI